MYIVLLTSLLFLGVGGYFLYKYLVKPTPKHHKLGPGHVCKDDGQCENGECARGTAADGAPLVCCPSGKSEMYGGYSYCQGMKTGSECWSDSMCGSGYCKGNWGGLRKGVCTQK